MPVAVARSIQSGQGQPWDHPRPRFLYKYFPPQRFHVLTDCHIRFTQRSLFDDEREFRPEVRAFGTVAKIREFIAVDPMLRELPEWLKGALVQRLASDAKEQKRIAEVAQLNMKSPDAFVTLCLTEKGDSPEMWESYAAKGQGFAVQFDTQHPGFQLLTRPGRLGKVTYADEPIGTFLGEYGPGAFFRKRTKYAFESEWRSLRPISNFTNVITADDKEPIYLSAFDPRSVTRILTPLGSPIETKLRVFISIDSRYRHALVLNSSDQPDEGPAQEA